MPLHETLYIPLSAADADGGLEISFRGTTLQHARRRTQVEFPPGRTTEGSTRQHLVPPTNPNMVKCKREHRGDNTSHRSNPGPRPALFDDLARCKPKPGERLSQGDIRDAAEKAWCATKPLRMNRKNRHPRHHRPFWRWPDSHPLGSAKSTSTPSRSRISNRPADLAGSGPRRRVSIVDAQAGALSCAVRSLSSASNCPGNRINRHCGRLRRRGSLPEVAAPQHRVSDQAWETAVPTEQAVSPRVHRQAFQEADLRI